jgi:glyoxylase-like metal-dependent hydrolase (beta-lactamase superfamily II)
MASNPLCVTCGTQFPPDQLLPQLCPICNDDRQYIPETGQAWMDYTALEKNFEIKMRQWHENLYEFKVSPHFAIGQKAFLVLSPGGNILWDCIPLLDEATIAFIKSKGGLKAIAISHPHYYSTMNHWAETFNCPVYIHDSDQQWIVYQSKSINLWKGYRKLLWDNIYIMNIGGHFPGSCILHVPALSSKGTVLCGDSLFISRSKRHISIMYSYPNLIMLTKDELYLVLEDMENLDFDTMYGAFDGQVLLGNAKEIFDKSMNRYIESYQ